MSDRIDISATIKVNDQASGAIGQMRNSLQGLQGMAQRVGQSLKSMGTMQSLGASMRGLGGALRGLGGAVMNVVRPVAALAGITGGIGMAEAVAGMEHYVSNVRELSRAAPVLGTTVERLSELQYAASRVGISGEEMTNAMLRANTAMGKAAIGKGTDLTLLLQKLRIRMKDSSGATRTFADILPEFADAIQRQTDPLIKQRMAVEMFGRAAGPQMLRLLEKGAGGIEEFVKAAREAGLTIGPEAAKEALDFANAQGEVRRVWQSLSMTLSRNLLPVLRPLIELFARLLDRHKTAIVEELTKAFQALSTWLQDINWEKTIADLKAFGQTIASAVRWVGGWRNALILVGLAMTGLLGPLLTVGTLIGRVALSLGALAFANPLIAIIVLAVAGLAYGAYLLWKHWDKVSKWFGEMWTTVRGYFDAVVDWLGPWGNLFAPILIYNNWNEITGFFSALFSGVKAVFWTVVDWLGEFVTSFLPQPIKAAWSALSGFFAELWNDPKAKFWEVIDWLSDFVGQFVPQPIKDAWTTVTKFFQALWDDVTGIFDRAWKTIEPIVKLLRDAIGWITGNIPSLSGIGETVKGWGGGLARFVGLGGGAGEAAPSSVPAQAQSVVQQATAGQAVGRVDGEVDVRVHMENAPPGTTVSTRSAGQVRATGDVGLSMAVPA